MPAQVTVEQEHQALVTAYGRLQRAAEHRTSAAASKAWSLLAPADLDGAWQSRVGALLVRILSAGQLLAAASGQHYVDAMVTADGLEQDYAPGAATVRPRALSGTASDGRPLDSLLYEPVIGTKSLIAGGATVSAALLGGQAQLLRIVASEVADAGRAGAGVAMAANRTVTGYVRCVRPGACARCAILAGKHYGWDADFQRHPRCQCYAVPATRYRPGRSMDPDAYFRSLSRAEQARIFTAGGAAAIRDGADIISVVNARRRGSRYSFVDTTGRRRTATREGTTRFGDYYRRARNEAEAATGIRYARGKADVRRGLPEFHAPPRLMPGDIYQIARSRSEVIDLLRRYGYLG